jgi:hypothetical protein
MKIALDNPQEVTQKVKKAAKWFGADIMGICRLDKRWVYSHTYTEPLYLGPGNGSKHTSGVSIVREIPAKFQYAVLMCYEMDYDVIQHYLTYTSLAATA